MDRPTTLRRFPVAMCSLPPSALQLLCGIGCQRGKSHGNNIDPKAGEAALDYIPCGKSQHRRGPEPHRKDGQLDRRRDPDKVPSARVVCLGEACCYADYGRYGKAARNSFERRKMARAALDVSNERTAGVSEYRADRQRPGTARNQSEIPAPKSETNGENLGEKGQKHRRGHNGHGIVINNARRQQNRAGRRPSDITRSYVRELPHLLDDVQKWFTHGPSKVRSIRRIDHGPQLARRQRVVAACQDLRAQERFDKGVRLRLRCLDAYYLALRIGAMNVNIADGNTTYACQARQAYRFFDVLGRYRSPYLVHDRSPKDEPKLWPTY